MLSSSRSGKSLWDQMFVSKDLFLKVVKEYDRMENMLKNTVSESYLRKIGNAMDSQTSTNCLYKAWVREILPDWLSSAGLKGQKLSSLLLTHLLCSSEEFIRKFSNEALKEKCIGPIAKALKHGRFPRFCDAVDESSTIRLVAGLLYGQMAYPSFPVVDKLLRLSYTAKKRQMFSDVFIFDKCRYVYEQFPSVDCSTFAISELHQQMVFRMVVDGLRKHLRTICWRDNFSCCNVASINATTPGGVDFPNSEHKIPERPMLEFFLFEEKGNSSLKAKKYDEAIKFYNKCEVLCPENAVIYAHKAHCYLNLKQPENAVSNCSKALNLDPRNEKALYIRAMAFKMQKRPDPNQETFRSACVCYLGGDNPINDLEVLVDNDFEGQFDIIYFDACGTLPSAKQNTLKFIGYVFLYNKLTSPGALITNFSFPPKQTAQAEDVRTQDEAERKRIRDLSAEYLKYRLVNTLLDDNTPDDNAERLSKWTDEDIYSDYITYQVIDSAYLFIPAHRMLSSSRSGKSCPLWDQMFVSKDSFLKVVKGYDRCASNPQPATASESPAAGKSQSKASESNATSKSPEEKLQEALDNMEDMLKDTVSESYLRKIGDTMYSKTSTNDLCKAWVSEIFPDWKSSAGLKDQKLSSLLLADLLFFNEKFILKFSNKAMQEKCLGPLPKLVNNMADFQTFVMQQIHALQSVWLLAFFMAKWPTHHFQSLDKLLRLSYTAKKRQMFSDVFIFDKCRYVYEQFPSVDCSIFAIYEVHQQMVFRMAVDGLSKHFRRICSEDVFTSSNVASINEIIEGGVSFPNCWPKIPKRQMVELKEFKEFIEFKEKGNSLVKAKKFDEAIKFYNKCEVLCPKNAVIYANKAHCYLKLKQPDNVVYNCDKALNLDPRNEKALYRRAMAFKMQKEYPKAVKDLEKVMKICKDCNAERELAECKKLAGI
ncbi:Sperm associated antigen 1 [Desmophyllum pertusum]|uniref:Sperm associated antigen 1 n=1 Tax=Desmophyllum pertusum TaxID=174260 RepID=A0A9X0CYT6_9CNID|nr:Sperm associated antigen 1 [Desmophyllum pertusum]